MSSVMTNRFKNAPTITVFTGPMFAGKSTKLIECYSSSETDKVNKAVFKYIHDTRYSDKPEVITHTRIVLPCYMISTCSEINKLITPDIQEIFIDEAQFFPDIYDWITELITNKQNSEPKSAIKNIYIAGLNLDAKGNIFNKQLDDIIQFADECHILHAKCYVCTAPAMYTKLLKQEDTQKMNNSNILIGGSDLYQPACKTHFH